MPVRVVQCTVVQHVVLVGDHQGARVDQVQLKIGNNYAHTDGQSCGLQNADSNTNDDNYDNSNNMCAVYVC